MARLRQKQLRYGLTSGVLAFAAGWAAIAILLPKSAIVDYPRWQTSLWVYLGAHLVELSDSYLGGVGFDTINAFELVDLSGLIYLIPVATASIAGFYTCYKMNSTRIKHNISNAMAAGMGYFLAGLAAMLLADIRPSISMVLVLAFVAGLGIWLGSTILGILTRGIPFIGIASLGGIAAIGIIIVVGGVAILSAIWGLMGVAFAAPGGAGAIVGVSRQLERRGRGYDTQFSRTRGLQSFIKEYWMLIFVIVIIGGALTIGLTK